jgi:hypothetical protein
VILVRDKVSDFMTRLCKHRYQYQTFLVSRG